MAVYAALLSLMTTLNNIQIHPRVSTFFDHKHIQSLHQIINSLLDFMESSNSDGGSREEEEEALERRIVSTAHAAEDVIESHVVKLILADARQKKNFEAINLIERFIRQVTFCARPARNITGSFLDLEIEIEDMNSIKEAVMEFRRKMKLQDDQSSHSMSAASSKPLTTTKKDLMVGFDEKLIQIMDRLTRQEPDLQVVPIVGMGGIGKTTLARNVYDNLFIVESFDIRAWVTVSQEYSMKYVFSELLSCIKDRNMNASIGAVDVQTDLETEDHQLGLKLYKTLWGRRYLIVLDDIWSLEAWDKIKCFFPNNGDRSRVVITTRMSSVATQLSSSSFEMNFLDKDQSWELFCRSVFLEKYCPPELVEIGKKIVRECKGLPLSIVVIGGLLRNSKRTLEYWENFARDLSSILISGNDEHCFNILSLSYNQLPGHLKPCFLYMRVFREDENINVSKLIKILVAEGFVKPKEGQTLEEVADDCLNDLVDRNLILVGSLRWNGRVEYCKMHDLVREVCLKIGKREKIFHRINKGRHIVRVLSFAEFESHEDISEHVNLRYLKWSLIYWNWFSKLPSSVSLLWNVQTLIHSEQYGRVEVPSEIWYMRHLRHLQFHEIVLPDPPSEDVLLPNLQTLSKVVNFSFTETVCKRIPNIKELCIQYYYYFSEEECKKKFYYDLSHLHKLQSLYCFGLVLESGQSLMLSSSLRKLSLDRCGLHWEDLNTIVLSLPQLEFLALRMYVIGDEWDCVEGAFPRLKVLHIDIVDLTKWTAENSEFFPVLEKLYLGDLLRLERIPSGIGEIQTLVYLHVSCCSWSVAISSVEILEEQLSLGNDDVQLEVDLRCGLDEEEKFMRESFRENVEKNNFTSKNFKLRY